MGPLRGRDGEDGSIAATHRMQICVHINVQTKNCKGRVVLVKEVVGQGWGSTISTSPAGNVVQAATQVRVERVTRAQPARILEAWFSHQHSFILGHFTQSVVSTNCRLEGNRAVLTIFPEVTNTIGCFYFQAPNSRASDLQIVRTEQLSHFQKTRCF